MMAKLNTLVNFVSDDNFISHLCVSFSFFALSRRKTGSGSGMATGTINIQAMQALFSSKSLFKLLLRLNAYYTDHDAVWINTDSSYASRPGCRFLNEIYEYGAVGTSSS